MAHVYVAHETGTPTLHSYDERKSWANRDDIIDLKEQNQPSQR